MDERTLGQAKGLVEELRRLFQTETSRWQRPLMVVVGFLDHLLLQLARNPEIDIWQAKQLRQSAAQLEPTVHEIVETLGFNLT